MTQITLIDPDHFAGQRHITPDPTPTIRDLAKILREMQEAVNDVVGSGSAAGIDMVPGAPPVNNPVVLDGSASKQFIPKEAVFVCEAGAALAGDVTLTIGTTPGGTEILAATPLTGLDAAGKVFVIQLDGVFPQIAGDAALDVTVTVADTGGGASGTMTAKINGEQL